MLGAPARASGSSAMEMPNSSAVWRARWAISAIFFANGITTGTWAAQIPLVEERLGVSHSLLGVAFLTMALGALLAMPLTGILVGRLGSARMTRIAVPMLLVALPIAINAPSFELLVPALLLLGMANGAIDVAMNAHGVTVERLYGYPIMSSLHGMWSLGGLAGAGLAAALLWMMPALAEVLATVLLLLALAAATLPFLLPWRIDAGRGQLAFAWPSRATLSLGALCFLSMMSEGAVLDWGALHLKDSLGVGASLAATGFAAFSFCMALGRFVGDRLRAASGATALVRWSALLAAIGLVAALVGPLPILAISGFGVVGLGLANLVPVFFGAAGRTPGVAPGSAIAAVATVGYSGFLLGPPIIGFVADATSLALALGLIVLACLAIAAAAGVSEPATQSTAPAKT